jgi:hypothetical protein
MWEKCRTRIGGDGLNYDLLDEQAKKTTAAAYFRIEQPESRDIMPDNKEKEVVEKVEAETFTFAEIVAKAGMQLKEARVKSECEIILTARWR